MTDVLIQDTVERLKEILRAKVNDPFSRGSDTTETLSTGQTSLTLSNKRLKNINSAIGKTTGNEYYRFEDFSVSFDNPKDSSDDPVITFNSGHSEEIDVNYHWGKTWVYPTFPQASVSNAVISIMNTSQRRESGFLGEYGNSGSKTIKYVTSWQIDIWVEDGVSFNDPDPSNLGHYSGGKIADYLSDEVIKAMVENKQHLSRQGIEDITLVMARDEGWRDDTQTYRKILTFDVSHQHEWS